MVNIEIVVFIDFFNIGASGHANINQKKMVLKKVFFGKPIGFCFLEKVDLSHRFQKKTPTEPSANLLVAQRLKAWRSSRDPFGSLKRIVLMVFTEATHPFLRVYWPERFKLQKQLGVLRIPASSGFTSSALCIQETRGKASSLPMCFLIRESNVLSPSFWRETNVASWQVNAGFVGYSYLRSGQHVIWKIIPGCEHAIKLGLRH